ncbi:MAG: hypothetical protein EG824_02320 [Deltaproteobacteria bacterium]|nr:hypothetical protein [Deltaproteobacteria bacterium]
MLSTIPDVEENYDSSAGLSNSPLDLKFQIRILETQINSLESLLDRILVCLNAYGSGEGAYSLNTIVQAIVREIHFSRLLGDDSDASEV